MDISVRQERLEWPRPMLSQIATKQRICRAGWLLYCRKMRIFVGKIHISPILLYFMLHRVANLLGSVWRFYVDGFRQMTVGRTLWLVILIKLFIIFVVLKLFFFPNYIHQHAEKGQEPSFVASQLLGGQRNR